MPLPNDPYSDPEMIQELYQSPENEVLLAEYLLQTGSAQLGLAGGSVAQSTAGVSGSGGGSGTGGESDSILNITEIQGQTDADDRGPYREYNTQF